MPPICDNFTTLSSGEYKAFYEDLTYDEAKDFCAQCKAILPVFRHAQDFDDIE